jgi:bifunctional DNA-binding transcriptional regulator/antitoxin component of YhaV-PrlF toxin-antitoxin module
VALRRVRARGQITIPQAVLREAGIKVGDSLYVEVAARGKVVCSLRPDLSPRELRDRYPIDAEVDEARDRAAWEAVAAGELLGREGE